MQRRPRQQQTRNCFLLLTLGLLATGTDAWIPLFSRNHHRPCCGSSLYASKPSNNSISPNNKNRNNKFAQPAFAQTFHTSTTTTNNKDFNNTPPRRSDSKLGQVHAHRIQTAGRVGTKRFVNPCKVFLGNLPYHVTEASLTSWICQQLALPAAVLIHHVKVVRDWQTGRSKGYAFVVFTEAIYATVCMEKCQGVRWDGRLVSVNQGRRKKADEEVYVVKKKSKPAQSAEEEAIQQGLEQATMDPEEAAMLRRLDPDLVDDDDDDEVDPDIVDFDDEEFDEKDDDDGVDGVWEGDDQDIVVFDDNSVNSRAPMMNREQRRDAARRKPRRKLPHKGFGGDVP